MTVQDLKKKHSSRPHNPILASAFFKGGLIEAWGRGTLKIVDECIKAGLPEPDNVRKVIIQVEYVSQFLRILITEETA